MKKVCIVTGGNAGIGKEIGDAFEREGYAVFRPSRRNSFDLSNAGMPSDILSEVLVNPEYGRLDVLVNNARALRSASESAQWRINLIVPYELARLAIAGMSDGGAIINIGSTTGRCVSQEPASYQIAKAAYEHMTRVLAIEGAPRVRCNCVIAGWISKAPLGPYVSKADNMHPLGRMGRPSDIADACLFLARAPWITGASLVVDGGMTLRDLSSTV